MWGVESSFGQYKSHFLCKIKRVLVLSSKKVINFFKWVFFFSNQVTLISTGLNIGLKMLCLREYTQDFLCLGLLCSLSRPRRMNCSRCYRNNLTLFCVLLALQGRDEMCCEKNLVISRPLHFCLEEPKCFSQENITYFFTSNFSGKKICERVKTNISPSMRCCFFLCETCFNSLQFLVAVESIQIPERGKYFLHSQNKQLSPLQKIFPT